MSFICPFFLAFDSNSTPLPPSSCEGSTRSLARDGVVRLDSQLLPSGPFQDMSSKSTLSLSPSSRPLVSFRRVRFFFVFFYAIPRHMLHFLPFSSIFVPFASIYRASPRFISPTRPLQLSPGLSPASQVIIQHFLPCLKEWPDYQVAHGSRSPAHHPADNDDRTRTLSPHLAGSLCFPTDAELDDGNWIVVD